MKIGNDGTINNQNRDNIENSTLNRSGVEPGTLDGDTLKIGVQATRLRMSSISIIHTTLFLFNSTIVRYYFNLGYYVT